MVKRIVELCRLEGDTPLARAIQADVHAHWVSGILPEEVMRINRMPREIYETDPVLVFNASCGMIEIGYRRKIRGEWDWVHQTDGNISHWMLLPLSPAEQTDPDRLAARINALKLI